MGAFSWLSILALLVTSAIAVVSLFKEIQEKRDKHEEQPRRWHWYVRFFLTVVGLITGVTLICLTSSNSKTNEARHAQERQTDKQQIAGLTQAIETQIHDNETQYLRHQQELRTLRDQVTDLKKDIATQELRKKMDALQARLDKTLAPRPLAKLQSGFWQPDLQDSIVTEIYAPVDGNVVKFDFSIVNNSDVFAKDVLLWLRICKDCKFHKEPDGSRFIPGAPPFERVYQGIYLPPGVRWQKLTVEMEVPPSPSNPVWIGTRYRCPDCEVEKDYQQMSIVVGRLPVPTFLRTPEPTKKKPKKP